MKTTQGEGESYALSPHFLPDRVTSSGFRSFSRVEGIALLALINLSRPEREERTLVDLEVLSCFFA